MARASSTRVSLEATAVESRSAAYAELAMLSLHAKLLSRAITL
jgi:hypothetical protein